MLPRVAARLAAWSLLFHTCSSVRLTPQETSGSLLSMPPLCDPEVVREQCAALNVDENAERLSVEDVAKVISMPLAGLEMLLKEKLNAPVEGGKIDCMELCQALLQAIPETDRPPSSDVACRKTRGGSKICDVDVSPAELESVEFPDIAPDSHKVHQVLKKPAGLASLAQHSDDNDDDDDVAETIMDYILTPFEFIMRLANMFRVFPLTRMKVNSNVGDFAFSLIEDASGGNLTLEDDPPWLAAIEKVNVQAQAYVSAAITKVPKSATVMKRWFGEDTKAQHKEVLRVLNSLTTVLRNVEFRKGKHHECPARTYAYVYPESPDDYLNEDGEYIFYICPYYFKATKQVKIETLTHEGSHLIGAPQLKDVCTDHSCETVAYGRDLCKKLAKEYPDWALESADNHCFYISDINRKRRRR